TFQRYTLNGVVKWMFQDVHEGGSAHAAGLRPGDVLLEFDGKEISPPDAPLFRMGDSTAMIVQKLRGERVSVRIDVPTPKSKKRPINQPRPVSWSRISDRLGLLKITMFPGAVGIDLARDIDRAIGGL